MQGVQETVYVSMEGEEDSYRNAEVSRTFAVQAYTEQCCSI
jgi:hypothetical protein